jgi:hypothetical protein
MKKLILSTILSINLFALQLPNSIYKNSKITPESSYETFKIMSEAKSLFADGKIKDSSGLFIKALSNSTKSKADKNIDQYDYLYAHYALLKLLETDKNDEDKYKKLAKKIISFLDRSTNNGKDIWEEGELGKFQLNMYKTVANHYAKLLYKESKREDKKLLKKALLYAKKAEKFIRDDSDLYLKETREWIENALKGNPPLKSEKESIEIIKKLKTKKDIK